MVSVHIVGGKPLFSAVAKANRKAWSASHQLTSAQYQAEVEKQGAAGFQPVSVCGYTVDRVVHYAALWAKQIRPSWSARHGVPGVKFQAELDAAAKRGDRVDFVQGFRTPHGHQFAALFEPARGVEFVVRFDLDAAAYQKFIEAEPRNGLRPTYLAGYATEKGPRFAVVLSKVGGGWQARHAMTAAEFQREADQQAAKGMNLIGLSGYADNGGSRYAALWVASAK